LGADFVFGDAHSPVEFEGVVVEVVAHGVEGDLVGDDGFLLGADAVDDGGDGFDGGVGVVGLVVGEELEGVERVDVVLGSLAVMRRRCWRSCCLLWVVRPGRGAGRGVRLIRSPYSHKLLCE
jgi:hypothetical protein